jgi:hypothetical protein
MLCCTNGIFRDVCDRETIQFTASVRYNSRRTRSSLAPAIADEGVVLTVGFSRAGRQHAIPPCLLLLPKGRV